MVEIDDRIVDDISVHDESFEFPDLVRYLERHHVDGEAGVARETIEAYARELGYDLDRLDDDIQSRLTDATSWEPGSKLYRVGDNLSVYPPSWHETLSDPSDLRPLIKRMQEEVEKSEGMWMTVTEDGVSEHSVLLATEAIADIDRHKGERILKRHRQAGEIRTTADQNPEGTVRVP